MPKKQKRSAHYALEISLWIFISIAVIGTVACIGYTARHLGTWIVLFAIGFLLCAVGLSVSGFGRDQHRLNRCIAPSSSCPALKGFYLNGRFFQPYEQKMPRGGRQFRLFSTSPISQDLEAALIRYLVNEGLNETLWPQLSERVEAESDWAFLG